MRPALVLITEWASLFADISNIRGAKNSARCVFVRIKYFFVHYYFSFILIIRGKG